MAESNYPSNSHKSKDSDKVIKVKEGGPGAKPSEKPDKPKLESVVTGEAVERKRPLGKRIIDAFKGDDAQSVGNYILFDVMIPSAKALAVDMIKEGAERAFFGATGKSITIRGNGGPTPYNRMYSGKATSSAREDGRREISSTARRTHNFKEIVFPSRGEADIVLERLRDTIAEYEIASLVDLYDLSGITGDFTDEKFGWTDLRSASVRRVSQGYILDLPPTENI
jgi:hypothetical protein